MAGLGEGINETGALSSRRGRSGRSRPFADSVADRPDGCSKSPSGRHGRRCAMCRTARPSRRGARIRLSPEVLSGEQEAEVAGMGALSGCPTQMGWSAISAAAASSWSRSRAARPGKGISLPLGVLRPRRNLGPGQAAKRALESGARGRRRRRPFYMVGGSWRTLARIDMLLTGYPLPIAHQYRMAPDRPAELLKALRGQQGRSQGARLLRSPVSPRSRMRQAARSLVEVDRAERAGRLELRHPRRACSSTICSTERRASSIRWSRRRARREGASAVSSSMATCSTAGSRRCSTTPIARLRLAACLLADVAWAAHPDFRAERGVEMALHGNWVGDRRSGPGDDRPGFVLQFRRRPRFRDPATRLSARPTTERASLGARDAPRPALSGGVAASLSEAGSSRRDSLLRLEINRRRRGALRRRRSSGA